MRLISKNKKSGFTLIELMAVIAIIAILMAVMVPNINGYITRSKKTVVITQVRNSYNAIETYNATAQSSISNSEKVSSLVNDNNGVLTQQGLLASKDVDKILNLKVSMIKTMIDDKDVINNIDIDSSTGVITKYKNQAIASV